MIETTITEETAVERYAIDYSQGRFHFPVPGQICFHICYPNQTYPTIRKRNVILVKCMGESVILKAKVGNVIKIEAQQLNEDTGDIATDPNGRQKAPFDISIPLHTGSEEPLHRPGFIRAIKVTPTVDQNYLQMTHQLAVSNAKIQELQQQIATLVQASSMPRQATAVWTAQPQQMQEYYAMPAEPYTMRVPNAFQPS